MPFIDLQKSLSTLTGTTVKAVGSDELPGEASVRLLFSDGSILIAQYWRIMTQDRGTLSSFDQGQKYGLISPINAIERLRQIVDGNPVEWSRFDQKTGDLLFAFRPGIEFHVFNFTGYEVWEIRFSDGTGEYSNNAWESVSEA